MSVYINGSHPAHADTDEKTVLKGLLIGNECFSDYRPLLVLGFISNLFQTIALILPVTQYKIRTLKSIRKKKTGLRIATT